MTDEEKYDRARAIIAQHVHELEAEIAEERSDKKRRTLTLMRESLIRLSYHMMVPSREVDLVLEISGESE